MKNWVKTTWDAIKETPLKTFVIGGGVFVGSAVVTWVLVTLFRRKQ